MASTTSEQHRRLSDAATEHLLDDLRALLGAERVLTGRDVRDQHGVDESFHPLAAPDAVVYPTSTEEAAAIVGVCARHGAPIVPFGAGTSLEGHVSALQGGVSVDMREMNRVLRLSVDDLDVTVQAGVTRKQLDQVLRAEGVFFPVDPGADATLGGMVATGASGTTTVRYGAMRENVLSLVVVTADGQVVRTRSRARKSSAGYDLTRLFIGSEGTLGLVCEVTLRVQPTPEAMSAAVCAFPTLRDAVDCVLAVSQNAIPVARIELLDEMLIEAINRHNGLDHAVAPTLFLEFHGTPDEVAAQAKETERDHRRARRHRLRVGDRRGPAPADVGRAPPRLRRDPGAAPRHERADHRRGASPSRRWPTPSSGRGPTSTSTASPGRSWVTWATATST